MYRFYISEKQREGQLISITGKDVNHIRNVLRLKSGDWVVACNGKGTDYYCRIVKTERESVLLQTEKIQETGTELPTKITLFQGIPKADKMDFILQKAVELGVYEIVPVFTKRCVVSLNQKEKIQKKQERYQAIAQAAAKQCDRGMIPNVSMPMAFADALDFAGDLSYNIIPYELADRIEHSRQVVETACKKDSVGIFIGPEGGFEKEEVEQAVKMGAEPITLGKRILRTETAGMALLAILMFQLQD